MNYRRVLSAMVATGAAGVLAVFVLHGFQQTGPTAQQDKLQQARNLGKAFFENPTTQTQAVAEFKKALDMLPESPRERVNYGLSLIHAAKTADGIAELEKAQQQDPKIPHTWFNLGIQYKKASQYDKAIAEFEGMAKLVPDEPITHYNLGVMYKLTGKADEALKEFELSSKLNPRLAGPHFQLYNAYRASNRAAEATREQQIFQDIKKAQAGAAVPEDLEWSFYAEIYDVTDAALAAEGTPAKSVKFGTRKLADGLDAATAGMASADLDGDGNPEVIEWSEKGIAVYKNGAAAALDTGLGDLKDVVSVSPGDFNNDGLADLAIVTKSGAELWINAKGKFTKSPVALPAGKYAKAVWIDYDHDYDLDLFLLGEKSTLVRNNGAAGFSDVTASFPYVAGNAVDGTLYDMIPDTDGMDLVVAYADRAGVVYVDKLGGRYEAQDLPVLTAGAKSIAAMDLDNDAATDLVAGTASGSYAILNKRGTFAKGETFASSTTAFALADLENRGIEDVAVSSSIFRNEGLGKLTKTDSGAIGEAAVLAALDFDADGKTDLVAIGKDGVLNLLHNETDTNPFIRTALLGVKNVKLSWGAKIEVKAGAHYQKRTYFGQPIVFGMRGYKEAETVRITWPNGLIQNEVHQAAGKAFAYKEAQRLSGSCPMIFTWNGRSFTFLTDVLGVAPLGASSGDGNYFPVDHDEYVQIPGEAMVPKDGKYEIRITEELREVSYLDKVQLIAVDHPASAALYTNDKFKSPPFPEFRLFGVTNPVHPRAARDGSGHDVLPRLLKKDRTYPEGFDRDFTGTAALHNLDLDFGATTARDNRAVLILNGWVDWADGSTFLARSQESKEGLIMPYLQVKNAKGEWQTVIADMGIPAGKPKTISVDLTGKFLSASREVRIVTNLCVYWDEIFLSEQTGTPDTIQTVLDAQTADLHFRGFSKPVIDPQRRQPENFLYDEVAPTSTWNPTPGNYTRFGDVNELVNSMDDKLALMGSGDELTLRFDATKLPVLRDGWKRDFLLLVDGWAKDADANTAFSKSVEPLPFHDMSAYPYTKAEQFPRDAAHQKYLDKYNVRPALRLLRPLAD